VNYYQATSTGAWADTSYSRYSIRTDSNQGISVQWNWCPTTGANGDWLQSNVACPDIDSCESDDQMKVDFINFVLNITGQPTKTLVTSAHHGFCAIDLQPLFDNSDDAKAARTTWANSQFIKETLPGSSPAQKSIRITKLVEYVTMPSEGAGFTSNCVVQITWYLTTQFSSIQDIAAFKLQLKIDFATALGVDPSRIEIQLVSSTGGPHQSMATAGGTKITIQILSSSNPSDPSVQDLRDLLIIQSKDPTSPINNGVITKNTDHTVAPDIGLGGSGASSIAPSIFVVLLGFVALYFKF